MNGDTRSGQCESVPSRSSSDRVAREVVIQLAATGRFTAHSVEVFASEDVVTLRGRVPTYYQKQLAQSVALRVIGARQLDNCVDVI